MTTPCASRKGSNCLPSKWSRHLSSMASHEPEFESGRVLEHARSSCTCSWTSYTNLTSIGSSIASTSYPTTDCRDDMVGWGRNPSTWWCHSIVQLNTWCRSDTKLTFSKLNDNIIVHYELWSSMLIFYSKNWPCYSVSIYPLNYHLCW
jgi:hypothetical protein